MSPRRVVRPGDLLAGCDEEQMRAITAPGGPLLVLAGAGSGKTRVLTRRIAWRVLDGSAQAPHVLALTFTRKAAAELRARLGALGLSESVVAGTFHSIALAELRRLAAERRAQAPAVLGSKAELVHGLLEKRGGAARQPRWRSLVHEVAGEIEWAKARLVSPNDYAREARAERRTTSLDAASLAELFEAYEAERRRRRLFDFEDLLVSYAKALETDVAFAASAQWRFRHLFVDEYQDVNAAQLRLLDGWCGERDDVCVVGDPDQAIYGWNGSDPDAIHRFADRYPQATVVRLRTNYRSTSEVLAVAAGVLGSREAAPAGGPVAEGPVPTLRAHGDEWEEATSVAEAARISRRPGRTWSQIAVLSRTNAQLEVLSQAFYDRGVPCRLVGEGSFLRRPHVAAALGRIVQSGGEAELAAAAHDLRAGPLSDDDGEGDSDEEAGDLAELAAMIEEYLSTDSVATGPGLRAFLLANASGQGAGAADTVSLLTFHRAKGLEWPVVFVTGLEEGFVPIAHATDEAALDEERRLLYVACTRAEEELHCSMARRRRFGERLVEREPSRYWPVIEASQRRLLRQRDPSLVVARRALATSREALATAGEVPGVSPSRRT